MIAPTGIITLNRRLTISQRHALTIRFRALLDDQGVSPQSLRFRFLLWRTGCKYQELGR